MRSRRPNCHAAFWSLLLPLIALQEVSDRNQRALLEAYCLIASKKKENMEKVPLMPIPSPKQAGQLCTTAG